MDWCHNMDEQMNIQWYPGHMTKTRRMMEESLKLVDGVCEILDARIPASSRNPDLDEIVGGKPRLVVLNRIDQADPAMVRRWAAWFKSQGMAVLETDCKSRKGVGGFVPAIRAMLSEKLQRYQEKGQVGSAAEDHGGGYSQCGEVHLYQSDCRAQERQGGEPPRCHPGKAVDHRGSGASSFGYAGNPLAEI